jgi:cell division septal protein FtsQ
VSSASIALPARTRRRIRVLRRRAVVFGAIGAILLAGYFFWFRDSSLVAVKTVKVEGVGTGKLDHRLEAALTQAGEQMTTLHVNHAALVEAAKPFPTVQGVSADPTFPSTLDVTVVKRTPVALIGEGDGAVGVASDGRVMRGVPVGHDPLPRLPLTSAPKGSWVGGPVLEQAAMLGAAPKAMLRYVDHSFNAESGIGVELDGGVDLLFGTAANAERKWKAAAAVLSDPGLGPLDYVDLTVPRRPAVGGVGHSLPPLATG